MLKQEHPEEQAAEVRVTAEDLARAIATFEARRQEEARRLEGTVVLGEAVRDLQLDVTPEELIAEIRANRSTVSNHAPPSREFSQTTFSWNAVLITGVTTLIGGLLWGWNIGSHPGHGAAFQAMQPYVAGSALNPTPGSPTQLQPSVNLSNVPDDQTVFCQFGDILNLPQQPSPLVFLRSDKSKYWPVVKHHGVIYVRGWMRGKPPRRVLESQYITLSNAGAGVGGNNTWGNALSPITFRIDPVRWRGRSVTVGPAWQTVNGPGIHLDDHAYENWYP